MDKIKVLEVNNIDLPGRRFNGYNMIKEISDNDISVKQTVIIKQSKNDSVIPLLSNDTFMNEYYKFQITEDKLSIHNVFSITTPALLNLKEYKEADIVHFHMFHNTKLSIYSLIKIAEEKKVIISLHDPWFLTGRCVHFYDCLLWQKGCKKCPDLTTMFSFKEDNCQMLWKLKKYVFDNIDVDIVVPSKWMESLVKKSPIFEHNRNNVHFIPFGIDLKKFDSINTKDARAHYNLKDDEIVLFLRAQNEFKGTTYVLKALRKLKTNKKIVVLTCENKGLLDEVKNKYKIIDLGMIKDKEMVYAMKACDIFLMPSKGESFGMMAIEAMASSKPVIVFDNTALPSVVHANECGIAVKDRSSDELRHAIEHLIDNKEERERRGLLGKKICQEEYQLDRYNKDIKDLYNNVYLRETKKRKTSSSCTKDPKIQALLHSAITSEEEKLNLNIDYSDPFIQEQIMIFNNEEYQRIKRESKKFKNIVKNILKKNKFLYNLIRKILRRN